MSQSMKYNVHKKMRRQSAVVGVSSNGLYRYSAHRLECTFVHIALPLIYRFAFALYE